MSLTRGTRRGLLRGGSKGYGSKILATGPIAYWMLGETAGAVAYDQISSAQNGAHTGVTLGQAGIGDGRTSPLYDGANDYTNIYSATFAAAFNGAAGTASIWFKVFNAAVWTNGAVGGMYVLQVDNNNYVRLRKSNANNQLQFWYKAGGTFESVVAAYSALTWTHIAITWSKAAEEMRAYLNGTQTGTTQVALGVWAGVLIPLFSVLGASGAFGPAEPFPGYFAHAAAWDRALTPAEIADLAVV